MEKRTLALAGAGALGLLALRRAIRGRNAIDFRDRVVVITGGSRGLGLAIAHELAGAGARLALLARDSAELERAQEDVATYGGEVLAYSCDVRDQLDVQRAIASVVARFGRIDALINNAGVIQVGPLEHIQIEDF